MKCLNKKFKLVFITIAMIGWVFSGWPQIIAPNLFFQEGFPPRVQVVSAAATSALYVGTAADGGGGSAWANETNAQGNTTTTSASNNRNGNGTVTSTLQLTNFGFTSSDIPVGSTIDGVTVAVEWNGSNTNMVDNTVSLTLNNTATVGANRALGTSQTTKGIRTYGSSSDLWGTTLTQADVTSSTFGVWLNYLKNSGGPAQNVFVYRVSITIEYTPQPVLTQSGYRLFLNTNSTDVGASLSALNTPGALALLGQEFRLRMLVNVSAVNLASSGATLKLQYVDKGSGTCASPSGGTPSTYTDVGSSTSISYYINSSPSNGSALTSNASDPINGANTIINQTYVESNNFTNSQGAINTGQDGKWDFSLVDNGSAGGRTYCFRVVRSSGDLLNTYTHYPEITTTASAPYVSFSISENSIGFGPLNSSSARYATSDGNGSSSDSVSAHTILAESNADNGYSITVNGTTLECSNCSGSEEITAIGGTSTSSNPGTEQFGLRVVINSGTGTATSPYNTSNWALDTSSMPSEVAKGDGDEVETEFGVRYISNISASTPAGNYNAVLTYTITANF